MDVEEGQNKLTELKKQLLFKTNQVADTKATLDHKSRSIQKINKYFSNYCSYMSTYKHTGGTIYFHIGDSIVGIIIPCELCSTEYLSLSKVLLLMTELVLSCLILSEML